MLLAFTIKNFRSFQGEQTLSLVASGRQPDHPEHLTPIPEDDNRALPLAAIYGANGAGKSNLVRAIEFVQQLVLAGTEPRKPISRQPFLLDHAGAQAATEFSLQFVMDGRVYAFGARVTEQAIEAEWLSLLRKGGEVSVYERATSPTGEVTVEPGPVLSGGSQGDHAKALALTKIGVLPNQLFLHGVGRMLRQQDQGAVLAGAFGWFRDGLTIIPPGASLSMLAEAVARDAGFAKFAGDFLRRVATGVDSLRADRARVEESLLTNMGGVARRSIEGMAAGETTGVSLPDGREVVVQRGEGKELELLTLRSEHLTDGGARVTLPFAEESDGTQRLAYLLPALHFFGREPGVVVIDEIDRSLHPLLAKGFVRTFLQACAGKGSQMIFTTHDTSFLDLDLLRRDEVWFANKQQPSGATELYSLADYKVRTDLKVEKGYLQGRFGAVPPHEAERPDWVQQINAELRPGAAPGSSRAA